jgi:hypothetical protein
MDPDKIRMLEEYKYKAALEISKLKEGLGGERKGNFDATLIPLKNRREGQVGVEQQVNSFNQHSKEASGNQHVIR